MDSGERNNKRVCLLSSYGKNHDVVRFYEVIQLGEVVHMDISSPEYIWSNIISKNRNVIRKAIKNDVKVHNGRFPKIYESLELSITEPRIRMKLKNTTILERISINRY